MTTAPRVFLTAPNMHPQSTGEEFVAWKWAEALSEVVDLTVFALEWPEKSPLAEALPKARVITAPKPRLFERTPRFEAMAKPYYPAYVRAVRQAMAANRGAFDIAHQIMPQAARYPIALYGQGVPYVIGPLGGALETPEAFKAEGKSAAWFTRARALDRWRFAYDPWLRRSYAAADLVLGVAPYMADVLGAVPLQRFEPVLELGVEDLPPLPKRAHRTGDIRLLHVGRGVRTKGLRDVIRAMGHLKDDLPGLTLASAGAGEEIDICRAEAEALGIGDRVTFHGLIPRGDVEALYRETDIFVFPSYREPAGNVVYEAMRWGLPVIAADRGGPGWIVDAATGLKVEVTDPARYARDIAEAIRALSGDPARRHAMGDAARAKLEREAFWPVKARALSELYRGVLAARAPTAADAS